MYLAVDPIQHSFNLACRNGDVTKMKDYWEQGASPEGISISLAGQYYPRTRQAFDLLLEFCPEVDFTYISSNPSSTEMAQKILDKKGSLFNAGGMAIESHDMPLLEFVVAHGGLNRIHLWLIANQVCSEKETRYVFLRVFMQEIRRMNILPTLEMFEAAKKQKNRELVEFIRGEHQDEANRLAVIAFWKKNR